MTILSYDCYSIDWGAETSGEGARWETQTLRSAGWNCGWPGYSVCSWHPKWGAVPWDPMLTLMVSG